MTQDMKKSRILNHMMHCMYELQICERKSNNLKGYYFRKQIEVAKRKLKPFKKELHPIERRSINL